MLGRKAEATERCRDLRSRRREPDVGRAHHHEPDASGGAVHGRDHRLRHPHGNGVDVLRRLDRRRAGRSVVIADVTNAVEGIDVGAGTEPAPRAGHDDRADLVVFVGGANRIGLLGRHPRRPGVEPVGAVERDQGDRVAALVNERLVAHRTILPPRRALVNDNLALRRAPAESRHDRTARSGDEGSVHYF